MIVDGNGRMLGVSHNIVASESLPTNWFQKGISVVTTCGIVNVVVWMARCIDSLVTVSPFSLIAIIVSVYATPSDVVYSGNVMVVVSGTEKGGHTMVHGAMHETTGLGSTKTSGAA